MPIYVSFRSFVYALHLERVEVFRGFRTPDDKNPTVFAGTRSWGWPLIFSVPSSGRSRLEIVKQYFLKVFVEIRKRFECRYLLSRSGRRGVRVI